MKHLILAVGLLALGAASAAAQDAAPATAATPANAMAAPTNATAASANTAATQAKADESVTVDANRISCVASEPTTGSRLGAHRTCHTEAEWDRIRADSAMTMQDLTNREMNRERTIHTGN
jgi:opacity protein-like surface antigen